MFDFGKASASLRARLIVIPPIFFLFGVIVAVGATLIDAPGRVAQEIASGITIGGHLIDYALSDPKLSSNPDAVLTRLNRELSHVRHIRVDYKPVGDAQATLFAPLSAQKKAPAWFMNWFAPEGASESFPIIAQGQRSGELIISGEASDEVTEIWDELIFLIELLSLISAGIVALIWLSTNQTLKPLRELAAGLDRLERGQFDGLGEIHVAELQKVGEQFNRLASSLARTQGDNRLLIDRLMLIQETERKELARDLHDEFGASLFGIRAAASCIIDAATGNGPTQERFGEIVDRANAISDLADSIQKHNHRILERIQPAVLDQMGLYSALRHLVDAWCAGQRDFSCELEMPHAELVYDEEVSLAVYRIIQESLTNVARHSKATNVHIAMTTNPSNGSLAIRIADDGIGLPANFRFGFGLLGMSERVHNLGGRLKVSNGHDKGTAIEVFIPGADRVAKDVDATDFVQSAAE